MCDSNSCFNGEYCWDDNTCKSYAKPTDCSTSDTKVIATICMCETSSTECSNGYYCWKDNTCNSYPKCLTSDTKVISSECMCDSNSCSNGYYCWDDNTCNSNPVKTVSDGAEPIDGTEDGAPNGMGGSETTMPTMPGMGPGGMPPGMPPLDGTEDGADTLDGTEDGAEPLYGTSDEIQCCDNNKEIHNRSECGHHGWDKIKTECNILAAEQCVEGEYYVASDTSRSYNDHGCSKCPIGQYNDQANQLAINQANQLFCKICDAGMYRMEPTTISTKCKDCEIGTYKKDRGSGDCKKCPKGKYNDKTKKTECKWCEAGKQAIEEQASKCSNCPAKTYMSDQMREQLNAKCLMCENPKILVGLNIKCPGCPLGTYCNASATCTERNDTNCLNCIAGKFSIGGEAPSDGCKFCPKGFYSPKDNKSWYKCDHCLAGQWNNKTGETDGCISCKNGTYSEEIEMASNGCIECAAGTYNEEIGSNHNSACKLCDTGFHGPKKARGMKCKPCIIGTYMDTRGSSDFVCKDCLAGYYAEKIAEPRCEICLPGMFQSGSGMNSCDHCDEGQYVKKAKQSQCDKCPEGRTSNKGASECSPCAAGKRRVQGTNKSHEATCVECPQGYAQKDQDKYECYQCGTALRGKSEFSEKAAPECSSCGLGRYGTEINPGVCFDCTPGQFGQAKGARTCESCPVNTYSNDTAATSITNCYSCPEGRTTGKAIGQKFEKTSCLCKRIVSWQNFTDACLPCPLGANCSKFDGISNYEMFPLPGYWRPFLNSTSFASCATVYPGTNAQELAQARCCPVDQPVSHNTNRYS